MAKNKELIGSVVRMGEVHQPQREAMFRLMDAAYLIDRPAFLADLAAKDWAILLHDEEKVLRGFTSLALMTAEVNARPVQALFSGDTIIQPDYWGSLELPRVWGRFMLQVIAEVGQTDLYWFLISSGYKTYRFLPVFFREFFPRFDQPTPASEQRVLDVLGRQRFADRYDRERGVIRLDHPTPLRDGVADLSPERLQDPHVAYFVTRNLRHAQGEELACLAPLRLDNLKPFIRRALQR